MDIATILGFVLGAFFIIFAIANGGPLGWFIDFNSMLIVVGGTLCATMISYPLDKFINSFKTVKHVFQVKQLEPTEIIKRIIGLANIARKEGLLALEEAGAQIDDTFLQKGVLLIVDGTDPELVRNILETELAFIEGRHKESQGIFETMGTLGPAFGMIGTLIGLIQMLQQLDDPSSIGPAMGVALITTFYGTLIANFICSPIAGKLKMRSAEEILLKEVMIEGLLSIQAGENPRIIEEKLKAFLSPKIRSGLEKKEDAEGVGVEA
ncbi:MotA/TolQ/ExbB proton channel family protein [Petroclostridium sp. X23]|uniref:motility protein A n=1 Tax=Petroclostridium sp. X23 TaxID=3045146 RepID=UPI0024AE48CC|nr:MotA/TolQ/ExbB proton channel family protein [Petroclostridium sp. X23]WHH58941.1 MotA/TolQ/ExbB proton channel family protein [Petroclostridium sp. X23]